MTDYVQDGDELVAILAEPAPSQLENGSIPILLLRRAETGCDNHRVVLRGWLDKGASTDAADWQRGAIDLAAKAISAQKPFRIV